MTERAYRIILGLSLMLLLHLQIKSALAGYIGLLIFEALTNLRVPAILSRLRWGKSPEDPAPAKINIDSERVIRFVVGLLLLSSLFLFRDHLWFVPWFIAFALTMAGVTGICPMAIALKKAGFR